MSTFKLWASRPFSTLDDDAAITGKVKALREQVTAAASRYELRVASAYTFRVVTREEPLGKMLVVEITVEGELDPAEEARITAMGVDGGGSTE